MQVREAQFQSLPNPQYWNGCILLETGVYESPPMSLLQSLSVLHCLPYMPGIPSANCVSLHIQCLSMAENSLSWPLNNPTPLNVHTHTHTHQQHISHAKTMLYSLVKKWGTHLIRDTILILTPVEVRVRLIPKTVNEQEWIRFTCTKGSIQAYFTIVEFCLELQLARHNLWVKHVAGRVDDKRVLCNLTNIWKYQ